MLAAPALIVNVLLTGVDDIDTLWYCPPDGSETVIPAGDVMIVTLLLSLDVAVMLAVIVMLVPVVAVVADAEVVTELTDALTEITENKSAITIEDSRILFLILSCPEYVCDINLLCACAVCHIRICKYWRCES